MSRINILTLNNIWQATQYQPHAQLTDYNNQIF